MYQGPPATYQRPRWLRIVIGILKVVGIMVGALVGLVVCYLGLSGDFLLNVFGSTVRWWCIVPLTIGLGGAGIVAWRQLRPPRD